MTTAIHVHVHYLTQPTSDKLPTNCTNRPGVSSLDSQSRQSTTDVVQTAMFETLTCLHLPASTYSNANLNSPLSVTVERA